MNLIVHAPNVHQGGGKVLLTTLLEDSAELLKAAQLDERFPVPHKLRNVSLRHIRPSLWSRIRGEWQLRKVDPGDAVLCFGNLPPLFGSPGRVFVFLQNRLLVDKSSLAAYPWRSRLRMIVERCWLKCRLTKRIELIVQTPSMRQLVAQTLNITAWVLPFAPSVSIGGTRNRTPKFDFIYVASGDAHKNHRRLVESWCLLREDGLRPSLLLTISKTSAPDLYAWIVNQSAEHDLNVEFREDLSREQILDLYSESRCLIYPSLLESYGLPLVEAVANGIPVIASERDFVRDVCIPSETFDPESVLSISRAVQRFLGTAKQPPYTLSVREFLTRLRVDS